MCGLMVKQKILDVENGRTELAKKALNESHNQLSGTKIGKVGVVSELCLPIAITGNVC